MSTIQNQINNNTPTPSTEQCNQMTFPALAGKKEWVWFIFFSFLKRNDFAFFFFFLHLGFTLFLRPLGSCPGHNTSQLTLIFWGKWSVAFWAVIGGVRSEVAWYGLTLAPASLTLYTLMQCEVARLNSLSNFFDVSKPTDGIHFHAVQKT